MSVLGAVPWGLESEDAAPVPPLESRTMVRYIIPQPGEYEIDPATGQFKRMPAVRQRFLLKATTVLGSSSVLRDMGIKLPGEMDSTFVARMQAAIRVAFRQETDVDKVARIEQIIVERNPRGRAGVLVHYTDLTTGESDTVQT